MDLVFELETGVAVNRHYYGAYDAPAPALCTRNAIGDSKY